MNGGYAVILVRVHVETPSEEMSCVDYYGPGSPLILTQIGALQQPASNLDSTICFFQTPFRIQKQLLKCLNKRSCGSREDRRAGHENDDSNDSHVRHRIGSSSERTGNG